MKTKYNIWDKVWVNSWGFSNAVDIMEFTVREINIKSTWVCYDIGLVEWRKEWYMFKTKKEATIFYNADRKKEIEDQIDKLNKELLEIDASEK